jgi:hypothetical protein
MHASCKNEPDPFHFLKYSPQYALQNSAACRRPTTYHHKVIALQRGDSYQIANEETTFEPMPQQFSVSYN